MLFWIVWQLRLPKFCRAKQAFYVPNLDCGDYVVVINADKVKLTGKKLTAKKYFKHTGWIGGIKETTAGRYCPAVFRKELSKAVERMISRNPMGRQQMTVESLCRQRASAYRSEP